MNPIEIAKSNSESAHQKAFFCWLNMAAEHGIVIADDMRAYNDKLYRDNMIGFLGPNYSPYTELSMAFAVPNGGVRGGKFGAAAAGAKFKAEGVKAGVPDVFVPIPIVTEEDGIKGGLWLELKEPGGGILSDEQGNYLRYLQKANFCCVVVDEWFDCARAVKDYLWFGEPRSSAKWVGKF